jgi:predicted dehydrogenase
MPRSATTTTARLAAKPPRRPRLGFAGVGWIGRNRLDALAVSGLGEVVAIADTDMAAAAELAGRHAATATTFAGLLDLDLDGLVIATPSALHAEQACAALAAGLAVFCQKPLARNGAETAIVVAAAQRADRLLGVDFSYRHTAAMAAIRELITRGELGEIHAVEAVFHNAYGPDKPWFYQRSAAGGGCLLDLGIHLVDLALWVLDFPAVRGAHGVLRHHGRRLAAGSDEVEDYAAGIIELESGASIQLACSWGAHAGCDAQIGLRVFGARGGAEFSNINGSFYDFTATQLLTGRSRRPLVAGADAWGGRAATAWLRQLAISPRFREEIREATAVAHTLDLLNG